MLSERRDGRRVTRQGRSACGGRAQRVDTPVGPQLSPPRHRTQPPRLLPFTAANPLQFRAAFPQPPRLCPPNQPASTHPHLFQESHIYQGFREGLTPENRRNAGDAIDALLGAGANPTVRNAAGETPWDRARDNEALQQSDAYWRLNDARFEEPREESSRRSPSDRRGRPGAPPRRGEPEDPRARFRGIRAPPTCKAWA